MKPEELHSRIDNALDSVAGCCLDNADERKRVVEAVATVVEAEADVAFDLLDDELKQRTEQLRSLTDELSAMFDDASYDTATRLHDADHVVTLSRRIATTSATINLLLRLREELERMTD